jgi:hypothetical protein
MKEDAPIIKPTTIWKRKENPNKEDCRLALLAENKEDEWYIDNGCSTHMTRDQNKFISLKKGKSGSVAFGNDSSIKILGKGVVSLGSENVKATNVLLVEYLKHNLLSVSKICDQGYNLKFDSRRCEIREEDSGRLVATTTRRPNNIYILDKEERKRIEVTQKSSKDYNKEGKDKKTEKEGEILLSSMSSGGASPKRRVTLFH